MTINIPGTIAVVVFYIAILVIGIIAGRKTSKNQTKESILVADRNLGFFVSLFTITATMVGGGYINGAAESAAIGGLLQTQAPIAYCMSLLIAAFTFVPTMRNAGYVTMFDPFQLRYGRKVGALLIIPQIIGDLFWSAAIFYALGATVAIILDINSTLSIVISAAVATIYTYFGGLYAVAYTDIIQLIFIVIGLTLAFPFALNDQAVDLSKLSETSSWLGTIPTNTIGSYIDVLLLCIFGGMVWQTYYQRILACRTAWVAKLSSILSCFFSLALAVPPIAIGFAGKAADWNQTSYDGPLPLPESMNSFILPMVLNYLTPIPVGIIGVGAVAAAVMSSADSCVLASSSVITKNVYQDIFRPKASVRELRLVARICIIAVASISSLIAIFSSSVYGLFVLCADLMYVIIFPQLSCVLWLPPANAYGCLSGYLVSFVIRMLSGEALLGIPAAIRFPLYDPETEMQHFPYRTFAMVLGGITIIVVSIVTNFLFRNEYVPVRYDILKCSARKTAQMRTKNVEVKNPQDDEQTMELTGPGTKDY